MGLKDLDACWRRTEREDREDIVADGEEEVVEESRQSGESKGVTLRTRPVCVCVCVCVCVYVC